MPFLGENWCQTEVLHMYDHWSELWVDSLQCEAEKNYGGLLVKPAGTGGRGQLKRMLTSILEPKYCRFGVKRLYIEGNSNAL